MTAIGKMLLYYCTVNSIKLQLYIKSVEDTYNAKKYIEWKADWKVPEKNAQHYQTLNNIQLIQGNIFQTQYVVDKMLLECYSLCYK